MKVIRKIIEIDEELCNGCGQCVPACAEGAIEIVNGKARLVAEKYCDGLGACLGECPTGALKIIEREAEDFDEKAVEEFLEAKKRLEEKAPAADSMACGCPSQMVQSFDVKGACEQANRPSVQSHHGSMLSHWPLQIRLIPPSAPFLKGADLLVTADCTAVAYPDFHREFVPGKVVMLGCPKFDNPKEYILKFREIFQSAQVNSVTAIIMEVPCCSQMIAILREAMKASGMELPLRVIVVGTQGEIKSNSQVVMS